MTTQTASPRPRVRRPTLPTPEEYAAFVGQIDLLDVWLVEAHVENRHGSRSPHHAGVAITSEDPAYDNAEDGFSVRFPYEVRFDEGAVNHARIRLELGLRFSSRQSMTDHIFSVFKDVNLPVNTWPFLREFVSTTLGRMGWQPFTLPALKQGVPQDDEDTETTTPKKRQRAPARRRGAGNA
jgi:hypothetical protein